MRVPQNDAIEAPEINTAFEDAISPKYCIDVCRPGEFGGVGDVPNQAVRRVFGNADDDELYFDRSQGTRGPSTVANPQFHSVELAREKGYIGDSHRCHNRRAEP